VELLITTKKLIPHLTLNTKKKFNLLKHLENLSQWMIYNLIKNLT